MTNTKAQVGDLIRIVNAQTRKGHYKNGDIFEVVGRWNNGVIIDVDSPYNDIYDTEYVIHRKAGEEDSGKPVINVTEGVEALLADWASGDCECQTQDAVHSPSHYTQGRFETIEVIEEITSGYNDGYVAYCVGNALKYEARAPFKHDTPLEDLRKAARYLAFAIEHEQRKTDASK